MDNPFHFSFRQPESLPNPLLKMEKVSAGYGERIILASIKLNLVPGSRIGLLGRNGEMRIRDRMSIANPSTTAS